MTKSPEWLQKSAEGIAKAERNNKPPIRYGSAGPAKGAGAGDGWGGEARGAGAGVDALIPGHPPEKIERSSERVRDRQARVAMMEDKLFDLAMTAEREETQIQAAAKLHAIYEGTPVQRSITAQVDDVSQLRDDEIRDELARLGRAPVAPSAGAASKRVSH